MHFNTIAMSMRCTEQKPDRHKTYKGKYYKEEAESAKVEQKDRASRWHHCPCPFVNDEGATAAGEFHGEDALALGELGWFRIPCENRRRRGG